MSQILENQIPIVEAPEPAPIPLSAFFRRVGAVACETGSPAYATDVALQEANVHIRATGDDLVEYAGAGLLIVADHRQGGEGWLNLALMNRMGRTDVHMLGKPYAPTGRIMHSMGEPMASLLLPVIPGTMDANKKGREAINEDAIFRILSPSAVLPRVQRAAVNRATLQRSANIVANGGAVLVAPTGSLSDASKAPWQRGIGDIVRMIPQDIQHEARIVFVRPSDFPKLKFIAALALRQFRLRLPRLTIAMDIVDAGTPAELLSLVDRTDPTASQEITERLQQKYLNYFSSTSKKSIG
ncbi:MAG TPA: hypothetical protein VFT53_07245 [Candidatus Saccharimonadales bacterium]|nr:hypothetical protein [Candidatus Saccharimonadales bacterium]